jgi:UPF0716 protein FxsA
VLLLNRGLNRRVTGRCGFNHKQCLLLLLYLVIPAIDRVDIIQQVDAGGLSLFNQPSGQLLSNLPVRAAIQDNKTLLQVVSHHSERIQYNAANMNPFKLLFVLLLAIPLIEVYLLMQVGSMIGAVPTILLVVMTAMMGLSLLKRQGLSTWMDAQQKLSSGQIPALQLMEGAALLLSGALLLTPGFLTDFIGFLGLFPVTRKMAVGWIISRSGAINFAAHGVSSEGVAGEREGVTVEGEFHQKQEHRLH